MMDTNDTMHLRSGITIYTEQATHTNQVLIHLLQTIPARFVLLCDVTGQLISARGEHQQADLVALGSLVAGDLAASQEIARLTGEYQAYQIILREGENSHTFIAEAGNYLALMVQIPQDVPLGWARVTIQQAIRRLAQIMESAEQQAAAVPTDFTLETEGEELSDMFGDALDNIWME